MMADNINRVNRLWAGPLAGIFCGLVLLWGSWAHGAEPFAVGEVKKPGDVSLLPSAAWPPVGEDQGGRLLKLSYLRGLIDALQYGEIAPKQAQATLKALKGLNLDQLASAIDKYYQADKRRRELPPAAVFFRILPLEFERPGMPEAEETKK